MKKSDPKDWRTCSYIFGYNGQSAVIDPRRDCQVYIDIAVQHGARITHIFENHRNEDYIAGSINLARRGNRP